MQKEALIPHLEMKKTEIVDCNSLDENPIYLNLKVKILRDQNLKDQKSQ